MSASAASEPQPSAAPAELRRPIAAGGDGRPPGSGRGARGSGRAGLRFSAAAVSEQAVQAFRPLAFAHGRVVERDHLALLCLGEAASIELPFGLAAPGAAQAAEELLAALPGGTRAERLDGAAPAARPVAIGALPFDPTAPGRLVVPELCVIAESGETPVAVACGDATAVQRLLAGFPFAPAAPLPDAPRLGRAPDRFELAAARSHEAFEALVAEAVEAIGRGELEKVVCAREVAVTANRPFEQGHLLERLRALYPSCAVFGLDSFLGASPELLVRRRGEVVTSQPLAGTIPRSGDPEEDARLAAGLLASAKERREHALVVEAIAAALAPLAAELEVPAAPHLLTLRNVSHLATLVRARLSPAHRSLGALSLAAAMAPTPAVGGVPLGAALAFLAANEGLERGCYAGPVGWVDAAGDGEFHLGIRSAIVQGTSARLLAGVGVVAGSDPRAELVETQLKLQALLAAAVRP